MIKKISTALSFVSLSLVMVLSIYVGTDAGQKASENAMLSSIRANSKYVVMLKNARGGGGTGSVINGVIITNAHVCKSGEELGYLIASVNGGEEYLVKILKVYAKHDLCAVENPYHNKGLKISPKDPVFGERIFTIGHPYLEPVTMTSGEISGVAETKILMAYNTTKEECQGEGYVLEQLPPNFFGIDNACIRVLSAYTATVIILPGNSGSPTMNIYGEVVAIAYAGNEAGTRTYHVPRQTLIDFMATL